MGLTVKHALLIGLIYLAAVQAVDAQAKQYRDNKFGVSVSFPAGWKWSKTKRWGDHESTVVFKDPKGDRELKLYVKLLKSAENLSPEDMDKKLMSEAEYKVVQRKRQGLSDYRIRPGTYQRRIVHHAPALSWVSEFTDDGEYMVEYLTRIRSVNSNALFFAFIPADELEDFRKRVDPIIESLGIP